MGQLFCRMFLILDLPEISSVYAFLANDAMSLSARHVKRHSMLLCLITGDINIDHIIKVISPL